MQIGSHHLGSMDAPWQINADLMTIELHPFYYPFTRQNNVAMLRLAAPLTLPFNDHVNVVCLPDSTEKPPAGKQCVVVGWGQIDSGITKQVG